MKDALRDRVITEKKDVAPGHVSAGFRHTGAHVSRQTFLANELSKKKKNLFLFLNLLPSIYLIESSSYILCVGYAVHHHSAVFISSLPAWALQLPVLRSSQVAHDVRFSWEPLCCKCAFPFAVPQ